MSLNGRSPVLQVEIGHEPTQQEPLRLARKERDRERHRSDVLAAAEQLLKGKPYHDIAMKDVAALSEFSVGYLYKLFPSKEELFTSLISLKLKERESIIQRCISSPGRVEERLGNLVHDLWAWREKNVAFSPGVLGAFLTQVENNPRIRRLLGEHGSCERELLESLFAEGTRDGSIRHSNPRLVAEAFTAMMAGSLLTDLLRHMEENEHEAAPELQSVVLQTFRQAFIVAQPRGEEVTNDA